MRETETAYNHIDKQCGFFSSNEFKWINKIRKLAESNPDEVTIIAQPENNDGYIYARIPQKWFKLSPPRQMSEAQKAANAERMKNMRAKKEGDSHA